MRKWFGLLCVILLFVLASCSSDKEATTKPKDEKVEIRYALWDKKQLPAVEQIIKDFNKKHPNIKVKVELAPYGQYFQKLETAATGNALPDVFWMNGPNIVKYASGNVLMPLDDKVKQDKYDLNNYPKSLIDLYTVNEKFYGIPKDFDTTALWYNKKLFDDAGIAYPDETWDWEKLKEVAKQLTNKEQGVWGFAATMGNQGGYYDLIYQNKGYVLSKDKKTVGFNKPEAIEALNYNISFIKEGLSPTYAQMTETKASDLFLSGKVAMVFDGPWMVPEYRKNADLNVAVMPQGKERAVTMHGLANVVAAKTTHPDAAWTFVKYLGSKEAANVFAETGTVIPAFNGTQGAWVQSVPELNLKAYIEGVDYSYPLPSVKHTSALWEQETKVLKRVWGEEITVEEATKELTEKANEVLSKK
ncbi:sugar ABC transporter substrate-binding protein [Bacillus manliponensis]|uniref:Sugar ABC transporter substrate-binding protein n=1 Tax=Bacillus manliponensis TaxID=574376 RepID=A0A073K922_9BACI|nr:sugar ABC transporter substrate-binding protein [Bacillus manliponensis]KEK18783.1 sugar ABC transporter substrate-binding protein [Bacillus manliponensis]